MAMRESRLHNLFDDGEEGLILEEYDLDSYDALDESFFDELRHDAFSGSEEKDESATISSDQLDGQGTASSPLMFDQP